MKKSIVSALTTALVVGAASTTFAAGNPFIDVPSDHWAYSAVSRLAAEGIIEGYGDGTYQGNRNITRYEMAQMVAKALAKYPQSDGLPMNTGSAAGDSGRADLSTGSAEGRTSRSHSSASARPISASARADLNRLAAEFRDELDGFGVRVAELEKHSDMVKWTGEVRYRYWNDKTAGARSGSNNNQLQVRLFPTAEVNEHWTAKARFTAADNMKSDSTSNNNKNTELTYVYAEGKYDNFIVNLGRMPLATQADAMTGSGSMIADDFFSGGQVIGKFDDIQARLNVGRWNKFGSTAADYYGIEAVYDAKEALKFGAGYHYLKSGSQKASIIVGGASYKLTDDMKVGGSIAHNSKANDHKTGYNVELEYMGANRNIPGSWGAFVAYRYLGREIGIAPTYDSYGVTKHKKGFDLGATYTPVKNTFTKLSYFHGKSFYGGTNKTWFVRTSFFF